MKNIFLFFSNLAPKFVAMLRDILVARLFFGKSELDDYFYMTAAILLPLSLFSSAFEAIIIREVIERGLKLNNILKKYSLFSIALSIIWVFAFLIYIVHEKKTSINAWIVLGLIFYFSASAILRFTYALMQAIKYFKLNFLLPAITPAVMMLIIFINNDPLILYISLAVGAFVEMMVSYFILKKSNNYIEGGFDFDNKLIRKVIYLSFSSILPSFVPIWELHKLRDAGENVLSIFIFSQRFPSSVGSIILGLISVLVYVNFVEEKKYKYTSVFLKIESYMFILGVLVVLSFQFFSEHIVKIVYSGEAINGDNAIRVSENMKLLAIELPFQFLSMIKWRYLVAKFSDTWVIFLPNAIAFMQIFILYFISYDVHQIILYGRILPQIVSYVIYSVVAWQMIKKINKKNILDRI